VSGRVVAVTGANGFVGYWLCRALVEAGVPVHGLIRRAEAVIPDGVTPVVIGDLTASGGAIDLDGAEIVVHLAARVHQMSRAAQRDERAFLVENVEATAKLLDAARAAGVRRFIYASSVKAIGEQSTTPLGEDTPPRPLDAYGRTKLEAERLVLGAGASSPMETVVLRFPLIYGPGMRGNMLSLFRLVSRKIPLPLASIRNRRSMLFVGNAAAALRDAALREARGPELLHVSDGDDVSTPELVRRIAAALGTPIRLFPFPAGVLRAVGGGIGRRLVDSLELDIRTLRSVQPDYPRFTMAEGLAATAAWYAHPPMP
jgi:UDP-glucose 4-epimerase